jgi:hypothetical protein
VQAFLGLYSHQTAQKPFQTMVIGDSGNAGEATGGDDPADLEDATSKPCAA